jgi:hypothetical protein
MKGLFKSVFVAIAIDAVDLIIINESAREKQNTSTSKEKMRHG